MTWLCLTWLFLTTYLHVMCFLFFSWGNFDFGKITKVAIIPFVFHFIYVVLDNSLCISVSSLSFSYCRGLRGLKEVKKHRTVWGMGKRSPKTVTSKWWCHLCLRDWVIRSCLLDQPRNLFSELSTCSARDVTAQWTIVCRSVTLW